MDTDKKVAWLDTQYRRTRLAVSAIGAARKQAVSEYDERLRKLKDYEDALNVKSTDEQQRELFDPDEFLDPSLDKLLSNPLHGLG